MAYSGELGHNDVPVMFHHFILNTGVFTPLLRPEEDQLWQSCPHSCILFGVHFSVLSGYINKH